jgi:hypothetical protein
MNDALRTALLALADKWEQGAGAGHGDYYMGMDSAYYGAAEQLREAIAEHERMDSSQETK